MHVKEKVLVTGANGLLGSNVVNQLTIQGYRVVAIVRKKSNQLALNGIDCEIMECNLTDASDLKKAMKGCDYVVHCAANTQQKPNKIEAFRKINIETTNRLVQLSKHHKIKRFIFVSTANCFTNGTLQTPGDETGEFMPWLKNSGYAYSKYMAQQLVLDEVKRNQFPAIVVAPTFIIGPRDAKISSGKLLMHGINKRVVFHPPGGKSIIDVEYAATAIVNSLRMGQIGESYLLSGENLTYRQIFKKISMQSHRQTLHLQIPRWSLIAIAQMFSFIELVFGVSLTLNHTNQRLLCLDNYFSNKKAADNLQLKATNADHAIKKAIRWYKENNYLK